MIEPHRRIRLLIVDDHQLVRRGIAAVLGGYPHLEVIGEAESGRDAIALHARLAPDVTLIDLRMPGIEGADAIGAIRRRDPRARLIALTTYDGEDDVESAMTAGAMGYLLKGVRPEELVAAIEEVHAGRRHIPSEIAARLADRNALEPLTVREQQILELLVRGRSNQDIAADLKITERTVKNHLTRLFAKLGVESRTQAALVALKRALVRSR
jgi:RNA polymerase sigma factor (sigma-70 family)